MTTPTPLEITTARKDAGLTQTQAAEINQVSYRTQQRWEAGQSRMHKLKWENFKKLINEFKRDQRMKKQLEEAK